MIKKIFFPHVLEYLLIIHDTTGLAFLSTCNENFYQLGEHI